MVQIPVVNNPWYKSTLELNALGGRLSLKIPHDVFSTQRIDEGTLLLLENLPDKNPESILDMGCGYGALGLPIAKRFTGAELIMVDRDLLAVQWAGQNAADNGLTHAKALGSLGFRDLPQSPAKYDWILCNVPARIGQPFIEHFVQSALRRLKPDGEIRVVVIRDLAPLLSTFMSPVAVGPRHTIFALKSQSENYSEPKELYFRDRVEIAGLSLDRPFDLGGDDPKRLNHGLPALIDVLPRSVPRVPFQKILCFRSGYGVLPLLSRKRWPESQVISIDRDLLGTTYTQRNAKALGLDGAKLQIRENAHFPDALEISEEASEAFDLIMGEISPSAGQSVANAEIVAIDRALSPGGQAFLLILEKNYKEWVKPFSHTKGISIQPLLSREGYSVLRLAKASR